MTLDANIKDEKLLTTIQQEYKILAEYKMIELEKICGIYVIPSYFNSRLWFGVIFGRQGVFDKCVFRFTMLLPDNFPDDNNVPVIIFQQDVMHPHVCPVSHSLDLKNAFPEWRTGEDHIWQVLKYMRFVFADPLESIRDVQTELVNPDAAKLLIQDREAYVERVKERIVECTARIFDTPPTDDPHYIVFERFNIELHGPILERIRSNQNVAEVFGRISQSHTTNRATGLSWVRESEFKPLSIE